MPRQLIVLLLCLVLVNCSPKNYPPVENIGGGQDVSRFTLTSLTGTRNGDRFDARVILGDGAGRLSVDLSFRVGVPVKLDHGTWTGLGAGGTVRERSVTFLGGQSGPPSLGGRFDLLGPSGDAAYRITIPLQPMKDRL